MAIPIRSSAAPSLAVITVTFVVTSALIGLVIAFQVVGDRARSFEQASLTRAVETRARGVQLALAQALYREWSNLTAIRTELSVLAPQDLQVLLNSLVGTSETISWAGFASNDGTVMAASNGLLVNANVQSRPWFQQGLRGDFAGDVHEALLLAEKLPAPEDGGALRFLDFSTPISGADGAVRGVMGLHLNAAWAERLVTELADQMDIDVFLVNPEGRAVIATDDGDYANVDVPSFSAARAGASSVRVETWPDGNSYFTATLPELTYRDLPKFGWSIIARIDADDVIHPARMMSRDLMFNLAAFGLLLLVLTALFIVWFIQPFARLAKNARAVAEGGNVYPFESNRTRELSIIGAAIARLQAMRHDDPGGDEPLDGKA